jgi:hypothetical protein
MPSKRDVALAVLVVLFSVGVAKGRPVRSNLGLGIGVGGGLGTGLDLSLGGSSSSGGGSGYSAWSGPNGGFYSASGRGVGAWALGMVTIVGQPMEVVTGAQLRIVARARHRAQGQDGSVGLGTSIIMLGSRSVQTAEQIVGQIVTLAPGQARVEQQHRVHEDMGLQMSALVQVQGVGFRGGSTIGRSGGCSNCGSRSGSRALGGAYLGSVDTFGSGGVWPA